jgi:predicted metalloprotease with PDZ domain
MMPFVGQSRVVPMLMPVIAHEYWHLWSPKRFHVHQLGPFDYQNPPRTTSLWFHEGLTEYYARLLLVRNGMTTEQGFLAEMEGDINRFRGREQRRSIADLSKGITDVGIVSIMDLYTKGPVIGMLLDALIRDRTHNRASLDDAMVYFNKEYGHANRTFGDDEIIPIIEKATGAYLRDFYRNYIAGVQPLPVDSLLPKMGLTFGYDTVMRPSLGVEAEAIVFGIRVTEVTPRGSADSMGIRVGDILRELHFDGGTIEEHSMSLKRLSAATADNMLKSFPENVTRLTVMRNGKEIDMPVRIVPTPVLVRRLISDPDATEQAVEIRRSMMGF